MLPIVISPKYVRVGVAGKGDGLRRRLSLLTEAGVTPHAVFDAHVPSAAEISGLRVLFVAGLDQAEAKALAELARGQGILVNVEDTPDLCDFHVPAIARRGDLLLTVSTGGRSPGLSRILRGELERQFGPEWETRLEDIAIARDNWRSAGLAPADVAARTDQYLNDQGWSS